jgi:hypothetical protein
VLKVADLFILSDNISLLDVDGDGYREILVGDTHELKGRPESEWPPMVVAYRWNGSALVRFAETPEARLTAALRQLFRKRQ